MVTDQAIQLLALPEAYFWATHSGAEIDLLFFHRGYSYGIEVKFSEAPKVTRSMHIAVSELDLAHLWVVYPGQHVYSTNEKITMWPLQQLTDLPAQLPH